LIPDDELPEPVEQPVQPPAEAEDVRLKDRRLPYGVGEAKRKINPT